MSFKLSGPVYEWGFDNKELREYIVITIPFQLARQYFKARRYSAISGEGEQREIFERHISKLKREMLANQFTPASATVGLTDEQRERIEYTELTDQFAGENLRYMELLVEDEETLPLLDAGHRMEALERILSAGDLTANRQPITAIVLLNGNRKLDFIHLQSGRTVDSSHMVSLTIQENTVEPKLSDNLKFGLEVAKLLYSDSESPFYKQIKFDSRGVASLPISTLMAKGKSDTSTSLVGTAKIAKLSGKSEAWMEDIIKKTYKILQEKGPQYLTSGLPLCPPPEGTKGGATIIVGIGNMMAWRLQRLNKEFIDEVDVKALLNAVNRALNSAVGGNFSAARKRGMMGDFVRYLISDIPGLKQHEGVPMDIIEILGTSAFGLSKIVKEKKAKPKKELKNRPPKQPKEKKKEFVPAFSGDEIDVEIDDTPAVIEETASAEWDKPDGFVEEVVEDSPFAHNEETESGFAPWEEEVTNEQTDTASKDA